MCGLPPEARIGDVPVCIRCEAIARRPSLPPWFRMGGAVLVALLALDLFWGARHWPPARDYVLARRAAGEGDWAHARLLLGEVIARAPDSDPAVLLKIKADLLSGDPGSAYQAIERFGDRKTENPLVEDINRILPRVDRAMEKWSEARSLKEAEQGEAALAALEEAVAAYPEAASLAVDRDIAHASVQFERGDYGAFTAEARRLHAAYPTDPYLHLMVASGIAAQYAVSGDETLAAASRSELEQALAHGETAGDAGIAEYAERVQHRLATREILSRQEYERRKTAGEIR